METALLNRGQRFSENECKIHVDRLDNIDCRQPLVPRKDVQLYISISKGEALNILEQESKLVGSEKWEGMLETRTIRF